MISPPGSTPLVDQLRSLAFRTAPAREANQAIAEARDEVSSEFSEGTSYELLLDPSASDEQLQVQLLEDVLPRWVYFVSSRRLGFPMASGLIVSLFLGETLHFIRGGAFSEWLVALSGRTAESLQAQYKA